MGEDLQKKAEEVVCPKGHPLNEDLWPYVLNGHSNNAHLYCQKCFRGYKPNEFRRTDQIDSER